MKLGYARVSTLEQDTSIQVAALRAAKVVAFWEEQRSGVKDRPALEELLNMLQPGNEVVVYKIDRLARSLHDLLRIARRIGDAGATLRSLTEPIETITPVGRLMFQMLGGFAEFERSVINERCQAGREAAMARGVKFGRSRQLDYEKAFRMRNEGQSFRQIAMQEGVSHVTVMKAVKTIASETAGA